MSRVGRILEQYTLFGRGNYSYGREDQRVDTDATVHTMLQQGAYMRQEVMLPTTSRLDGLLLSGVGLVAQADRERQAMTDAVLASKESAQLFGEISQHAEQQVVINMIRLQHVGDFQARLYRRRQYRRGIDALRALQQRPGPLADGGFEGRKWNVGHITERV